jgi:hypothetical protein
VAGGRERSGSGGGGAAGGAVGAAVVGCGAAGAGSGYADGAGTGGGGGASGTVGAGSGTALMAGGGGGGSGRVSGVFSNLGVSAAAAVGRLSPCGGVKPGGVSALVSSDVGSDMRVTSEDKDTNHSDSCLEKTY